jgi:hypothetical protein
MASPQVIYSRWTFCWMVLIPCFWSLMIIVGINRERLLLYIVCRVHHAWRRYVAIIAGNLGIMSDGLFRCIIGQSWTRLIILFQLRHASTSSDSNFKKVRILVRAVSEWARQSQFVFLSSPLFVFIVTIFWLRWNIVWILMRDCPRLSIIFGSFSLFIRTL